MMIRDRAEQIRCDDVRYRVIDCPVFKLTAAILFMVPDLKHPGVGHGLSEKHSQKTQAYSFFKEFDPRSLAHIQFPVSHPLGLLQDTLGLVSVLDEHVTLLIPETNFVPFQYAYVPLMIASGECVMLQAGQVVYPFAALAGSLCL
jgi:hypothetical protein